MADDKNGTSKPERPIPWNGVRPGEEPGRDHVNEFLIGSWVGSFSSFVHDEPIDPNPAPQIAAYLRKTGGGYEQTDGYFLAATILCLRFDGNGGLTGKVKINRGGEKLLDREGAGFAGSYTRQWNDELKIIEGTFSTIYRGPNNPDIQLNYYYIAKDWNELEWLWMSCSAAGKPFRPSVAQGTLTRVRYPRPL